MTTQRAPAEIRDWLLAKLTEIVSRDGLLTSRIDDRTAFRDLGVDSVRASRLTAALGEWLGRDLDVAMMYDYPDARSLAAALTDGGSVARRGPTLDQGNCAVAIVGIGCRFAGAHGVEEFWNLLIEGKDGIGPVPDDRKGLPEARHWAHIDRPEACFEQGGYLPRVDRFDAQFFGISAAEATRMDPQQRLLLEVTYDALVDAAIAPSGVRGSATGVYVGIASSDYSIEQLAEPSQVDTYTSTGVATSMAANRLSYVFDFRGPSVAIDTACSSSAVAIHEACLAIRRNDVSMAIAAGVNIILSPAVTLNFAQAGVLAPDARCKTFSEEADGYVRAEGVAAIVLKSLDRALADGDRVYGVILGGAVTHGGRTNGLMSPSGLGQARAFEAALANSGVKARDVDYVEAHGTGTFIGDPIEVNALGRVLETGLARTRKCLLGSVKTNIGHTEAAAGIAGVIKVALGLYHRRIAASLHAGTPNSQIHFDTLPLEVVRETRPWPGRAGQGCASVASVGFGGTLCHLVLAEALHPAARLSSTATSDAVPEPATAESGPWFLPVSASTDRGLEESLALWSEKAHALAKSGEAAELRILLQRSTRGRDQHAFRRAVAAPTLDSFVNALAQATPPRAAVHTAPRVVFVCPGQGSQWLGMGRGLLLHEPAFRAAFEACDAALAPFTETSLLALLHEPSGAFLSDIALVQPALFAFEVALAALWQDRGILPSATIGHSMGEVAAAQIAGALTLEDAARVIALRSKLMKRLRGRGGMAFTELSQQAAREVIEAYGGRICIAASNSPRATVLAGDADALAALLGELEERGVFARTINVDVASHSAHVDSIAAELGELLACIQPRESTVPMWSTVLGAWVQGPELDARYWVCNLRDPVRFAEGVEAIGVHGRTAFVELSPHPVLLTPIEQCLASSQGEHTVVASLRRDRDERACIAESAGQLFEAGCDLTWSPPQDRSTTSAMPTFGWAPPHVWDDQTYWWRAQSSSPASTVADRVPTRTLPPWEEADFWEGAIEPATDRAMRIFEFTFTRDRCGVFEDHQVAGRIVLPAALHMVLAVQAAAAAWRLPATAVVLAEVCFLRPIVAERSQRVQIVFEDESKQGTHARVKIFVRDAGEARDWQLASECEASPAPHTTPDSKIALSRLIDAWPERTDELALYEDFAQLGIGYGRHFRGVRSIWRCDGAALGQIIATPEVAMACDRYVVHPALLDAALHLLWPALDAEARTNGLRDAAPHVPVHVERVRFATRDGGTRDGESYWVVARKRKGSEIFDLELFDAAGRLSLTVEGLRTARVSITQFGAQALEHSEFVIEWCERASCAAASMSPSVWLLLADAEGALTACVRDELLTRGHRVHVLEYAKGGHAWQPSWPRWPEPIDHVLNLQTAWAPAAFEDSDGMCRTQADGYLSLLALVQSLERGDAVRLPTLTVATSNAQPVGATSVSLVHATAWGLGRVVAAELPLLKTRLIDLERGPSASMAQRLVEEVHEAVAEPEVALRGLSRFVPRLTPAAAPGPARVQCLSSTSSYLVTGGAGALGSLTARRFIAAGAGAVVLCGRRSRPPSELAAWLASEPRARYAALDVADLTAVSALLRSIDASGLPLRGVVHAAGVLADASLGNLTPASFETVMAPKRDGAWNLHHATADCTLDFFVVYSSVTSLVGSPGQANYAAANAFLDQLCWARRAHDKPALTINWGPFADVGMAATAERGGRLDSLGILSISVNDGLDRLMGLIDAGYQGQYVVFPFDRERLSRAGLPAPILTSVLANRVSERAQPARPQTVVARESGTADLETFLREQLAGVLRCPVADVGVDTPFTQFGIESLAILQFKNKLEAALGVIVPATVVWKHPTIRSLAQRLEEAVVQRTA